MNVSAVICTHGSPHSLIKTFTSLVANKVSPAEIIIVEQGGQRAKSLLSDFSTKSIPIKIITSSTHGLAVARNLGWRAAKGDIIAYTDDDAYVNRHWIEQIIKTFNKKKLKVGVVGGPIIPIFPKGVVWPYPSAWHYILPALNHGTRTITYPQNSKPPGVNYAISKKLIKKLGGFDECLGVSRARYIQLFGEDTDISFQVEKLGYTLIYNPKVICYHPVQPSRLTLKHVLKRLFIEGNTDKYLEIKHQFNTQRVFTEIKMLFHEFISFSPTYQKIGIIARRSGRVYRSLIVTFTHHFSGYMISNHIYRNKVIMGINHHMQSLIRTKTLSTAFKPNRDYQAEEGARNQAEVDWWLKYIFKNFSKSAKKSEKIFIDKFVQENITRWHYILDPLDLTLTSQKKSVILDLGNGPCGLLNAIEAKIKIGVDPNNPDYAINHILYNIPGNNVYLKAHAEQLPCVNNYFDLITCVNVLDHTIDPNIIVNEVKRVLKPNGLFFLSVDTRKTADTSVVHPHAINKKQIMSWIKPLKLIHLREDQPCYDEHPTNKRIDAWFNKPA